MVVLVLVLREVQEVVVDMPIQDRGEQELVVKAMREELALMVVVLPVCSVAVAVLAVLVQRVISLLQEQQVRAVQAQRGLMVLLVAVAVAVLVTSVMEILSALEVQAVAVLRATKPILHQHLLITVVVVAVEI